LTPLELPPLPSAPRSVESMVSITTMLTGVGSGPEMLMVSMKLAVAPGALLARSGK